MKREPVTAAGSACSVRYRNKILFPEERTNE